MTPRQKQALAIVAKYGPISRGDVAKRMQVAPPTAEQHLAAVRKLGLVSVRQAGRFSKWALVPEESRAQYIRPARSVWEWRGSSAESPA